METYTDFGKDTAKMDAVVEHLLTVYKELIYAGNIAGTECLEPIEEWSKERIEVANKLYDIIENEKEKIYNLLEKIGYSQELHSMLEEVDI